MANKIKVTLFNKEVAIVDIARHTYTNKSYLRSYYTKRKDKYNTEEIFIDFIKERYDSFLMDGMLIMSGVKYTPEEFLRILVNKIYDYEIRKTVLVNTNLNISEQCVLLGSKYGIDRATLRRYYTSTLKKAERLGVSWSVEKAAQEILRKPQFMERLNNLGYVDSIIKSRIENIYNNNHLIKSNTELLNMIRQDRLCDIPLRKELRKRCAEEGIAETSILPMLNKYKHLSLDEIIQGFKNKTLRRI